MLECSIKHVHSSLIVDVSVLLASLVGFFLPWLLSSLSCRPSATFSKRGLCSVLSPREISGEYPPHVRVKAGLVAMPSLKACVQTRIHPKALPESGQRSVCSNCATPIPLMELPLLPSPKGGVSILRLASGAHPKSFGQETLFPSPGPASLLVFIPQASTTLPQLIGEVAPSFLCLDGSGVGGF